MKATGMRAIGRMGVAAAVLAMSVLVTPASAGTMYWDIDGDTAGSGANTTPAGTWDAANTFWSSSADGDVATAAWTAGDTAVFAAGTDASGTYTVTVSGTNDIGGLTFEEGTVTLDNPTGVNVALRMVANSIFDVATGKSVTLDGAVSGFIALRDDGTAHTLTKTGGGTLTVKGSVPYTGMTIVDAGMLDFQGSAATHNGPVTINNGGTMRLTANRTLEGAAVAVTVNAGGLIQINTAANQTPTFNTLNINGGTVSSLVTGSFAKNPTIYAGYAGGASTSTISAPVGNSGNNYLYNVYVASGSTLLISGQVLNGTGASKLTKLDPGTLILSGNDTYAGVTTVSGGCLIIDGNPRTAAVGTITVASGARFGGGGTVSGNVTFSAGSALVFDPVTPRTLKLKSLKTLSFSAGRNYKPSDLVAVDGSAIDWDALNCPTSSTTFTLVQGVAEGDAGTVDFTNISTAPCDVGTTGRKAFFKGSGLQLL